MITIALLISLIGLLVWLIFTKWQKVADGWVAELGRISFAIGLLAWLLNLGIKTVG